MWENSSVYHHIWQRKASDPSVEKLKPANVWDFFLKMWWLTVDWRITQGWWEGISLRLKGLTVHLHGHDWTLLVSWYSHSWWMLKQERPSWCWSASARPQRSAWAKASLRLCLYLLVYYFAHLNFVLSLVFIALFVFTFTYSSVLPVVSSFLQPSVTQPPLTSAVTWQSCSYHS